MANFRGGSTLLVGGRFLTPDPAEDRSAAKKEASKGSTDRGKPGQYLVGKATLSEQRLDALRLSLIHQIVDQVLAHKEVLKVGKNTHPMLLLEISSAGGTGAWAEGQQEYKKILERKARKIESRAGKNSPGTKLVSPKAVKAHEHHVMRSPQADRRMQTMVKIVDAIVLSRATELNLELSSELEDEIRKAGGPFEWAREQPNYILILQQRFKHLKRKKLKPKPVQNQELEQQSEKRKILTKKQLLDRGRLRVIVPDNHSPPTDLDRLCLDVGMLPVSPSAQPNWKAATRKQRTALCSAWKARLDTAQRIVWQKLSPNYQDQYIKSGIIRVRVFSKIKRGSAERKTPSKKVRGAVSDMPTSSIIRRVLRTENEKFDPNKIDWSST